MLYSNTTWHGTPDMRVRGTEIIRRIGVDEDDEYDSDGDTTPLEGKIKFKDAILPQAVSTCVVSSFTDRKVCMEMVEEHRRETMYPQIESQCTRDCKSRGKIIFLIVDTIRNNSPSDSKIIR